MIAIDASRSMSLGGAHASKRETMMFVTAALLFSALGSQVNAGFVAFSDRVLLIQPPRRTRAAAWSILQQCWESLVTAVPGPRWSRWPGTGPHFEANEHGLPRVRFPDW